MLENNRKSIKMRKSIEKLYKIKKNDTKSRIFEKKSSKILQYLVKYYKI